MDYCISMQLRSDVRFITMADANINAPEVPVAADSPPTRSYEQILPLDILKNTNFFKDFTASSTIPTIYIQQFWDTIRFDKDKGYSFQLDEQHFYLTKSTLREALQLPQDNNNFTPPPNSNTIISFVNDLGYQNVVRTLSGIVAKYQRYLTEEVFSDDEAPATKPAKGAKPKTTRKPKPQSPKTTPVVKPTASKISKSTSSQPPKPKPAPVKPQEKKRNLVLDAAEAPSQAKHSKVGKVLKKRKLQSTLQLVDEFVDEGIPADEPRFGDEEADMCKAVEEILKDAYVAPRGSLPQVVIREPEPGKYEPLLEVQGKGKENVGEEQAAQVLLNLQTPKKKNSAEQFIFQRRTSAPIVPSSHEESSSLHVELGLTDSETESDNEASREGQA
ncbi:hypothetical protein Tco_1103172, partial [Tanacetum coccineum]